jgi:hypothetical protein
MREATDSFQCLPPDRTISKESSRFLLDDVRCVVTQFKDGPKAVMTSFEERVTEGVGGFFTDVSSKTITSGDDDDVDERVGGLVTGVSSKTITSGDDDDNDDDSTFLLCS